MPGTSTLPYYEKSKLTAAKSFLTLRPVVELELAVAVLLQLEGGQEVKFRTLNEITSGPVADVIKHFGVARYDLLQ